MYFQGSEIADTGTWSVRDQRIAAGVRLIQYTGDRLTPAEANARYPDNSEDRHHTYLFAIDDDIVIDGGGTRLRLRLRSRESAHAGGKTAVPVQLRVGEMQGYHMARKR